MTNSTESHKCPSTESSEGFQFRQVIYPTPGPDDYGPWEEAGSGIARKEVKLKFIGRGKPLPYDTDNEDSDS